MLSEYQRHIAYSNAQAAWGRLYNSLGLDVEANDSSVPVRTLAVQIRHSLLRWQVRTFDTVPIGSIKTLPIALGIEGAADEAERAAIAAVFTEALQRREMLVVDSPENGIGSGADSAWRLQARRRLVGAGAKRRTGGMGAGAVAAQWLFGRPHALQQRAAGKPLRRKRSAR